MKNVRQSNVNIHKDAWVEINLEYLAENIQEIRKLIPKEKKFLGIVSGKYPPCSRKSLHFKDVLFHSFI